MLTSLGNTKFDTNALIVAHSPTAPRVSAVRTIGNVTKTRGTSSTKAGFARNQLGVMEMERPRNAVKVSPEETLLLIIYVTPMASSLIPG